MNDYLLQIEQDACKKECSNYLLSISSDKLNKLIADAFINGWKSHSKWYEKAYFDDGK